MERLTVGWTDNSYDTFDPIDIAEDEYSKINYEKVLTKLGQYEDAEEQGLLLRLPCKVGDMVWGLVNYCNDCPNYADYCHKGCTNPAYRLKEFQVDHFEIHNNGLRVSALSHYKGEGKWGQTVFLTKEEAEQKLASMQKGE